MKNTYFMFNQFKLFTEINENYPKEIELSGKYGDEYKDINLKEEYDDLYITRSSDYYQTTSNVDIDGLLSGIKVEIPESNVVEDISGTYVNELGINLCSSKIKCKSDIKDLSSGDGNSITSIPCEGGFKSYYCHNTGKWEQIEYNCTNNEIELIYKVDGSFTVGNIYNNVYLFAFSGKDISYSISPTIEGMTMDKDTGALSGIPKTSSNSVHTVTATDDEDEEKEITLTINIQSSNFFISSYSGELKLPVLVPLENQKIIDVVSGSSVTYKASVLPYGVALNSETGELTGKALYMEDIDSVITVTSNGNSIKRIITIKVNSDKVVVGRNDENVILYKNYDYKTYQPVLCYGYNIKYSITPSLPSGYTYSPNGFIIGKSTSEVEESDYTITCSGDGGEDSATIKFKVILSNDPVLEFVNDATLVAGTDYENGEYFKVSGSNLTYETYPNLPDQLKITVDGKLSGYAIYQRETTYIITVSNGNTSIAFNFKIIVNVPESPVVVKSTIPSEPIIFGKDRLINDKLFVIVGKVKLSINPQLPLGLILTDDAIIAGSVIEESPAQDYVITITPSSINADPDTVTITMAFSPLTCKADDGFPETLVDRTATKKCDKGKSGYILRKCQSYGRTAEWLDSVNECKNGLSTGLVVFIVIICIIAGGMLFFACYFFGIRLYQVLKRKSLASQEAGGKRYEGMKV